MELCQYCKIRPVHFLRTQRCTDYECQKASNRSKYKSLPEKEKKRRHDKSKAMYKEIKEKNPEEYKKILNERKIYYDNLSQERKKKLIDKATQRVRTKRLKEKQDAKRANTKTE